MYALDFASAGGQQGPDPAELTLAAAALIALLFNVWLAFSTHRQADASRRMIQEALRDRELAYWPYLIQNDMGDVTAIQDKKFPVYEVSNVGRGPAFKVRFLYWPGKGTAGKSGTWLFAEQPIVPPIFTPTYTPMRFELVPLKQAELTNALKEELAGVDWQDVVGEIVVLECRDQFGNRHRFASTHVGPEIRVEGEPVEWKLWAQWSET
jgi:hypothetical protein